MTEVFSPGDLVNARGREWITVPSPQENWLALRPLSGSESDIQLIDPNKAVKALKDFILDHQAKVKEATLDKLTAVDTEKNEWRKRLKEREYWERFTKVVDEKTFRTWQRLRGKLENYNQLLQARS